MPNTNPAIEINMQPRKRIRNFTAAALIAVALIVDGGQFFFYLIGLIPIIGPVIALLFPMALTCMTWIMFFVWFKLLDINFLDGLARKALIQWGNAFLELVPLLNAFPIWTLGITLMIVVVRLEDWHWNTQQAAWIETAGRALKKRSVRITKLATAA